MGSLLEEKVGNDEIGRYQQKGILAKNSMGVRLGFGQGS